MSGTIKPFRCDAVTKNGLESLCDEMRSEYARHLKERIDPICERYRRAVANRLRKRASILQRDEDSASAPPGIESVTVTANIATYRERQRWPFVVVYHRRAYREYGLTGVLWLMRSLSRDTKAPKLSAVVLLMMTRPDDLTPGVIMRWIRQLEGEGLPVAPTMKRPGRRALGATAMTPAERQRRHRVRKRAASDK
ncbi:hypothetical protein [Methylorubrum sp. SB2]|uniref:hypothetical protein n=1 Tax=Methylorubrum TaxID=2282523 RepID=UPI00313E51CB